MWVPMRLPRADVNTKLCCLCGVSSSPRCLIQFVRLSVMKLIGDYDREMMLFCTVVKHGLQTAEKRLNWLHLQVWAALCYGPGWATAKVGVKMYVWTHDTEFRNTQRSVLWYFCPLESWSEGHVLTECNRFFFWSSEIPEIGFLAFVLRMYVSVCWRLHPLSGSA